jgi:phosphopantothenoylcysteine decarboxylase/phosphopantothenate--cysteine ligase
MQGKTIVLGVCGGIAAYKACDLASKLTQRGARVSVVMTASATRFVAPLTFQALTQRPVLSSLWPESSESEGGVAAAMAHIALANEADAIVVAPASADFLARAAAGLADDLLSTILLATRAPVLFAPAMNPAMWEHALTQRNRQVLADAGYHFAEPGVGRMACEHVGAGRLPPTDELIARLEEVLEVVAPAPRDLGGVQVLVTAGPTREALDPVRFLSNRSSGRMGYAIAEEAARRGAHVTLISGPSSLSTPPGVERVDVSSAQEMLEATAKDFAACDVLVAAAAPADFRAAKIEPHKIKKAAGAASTWAPQLEATPDIVATLARAKKPGQTVVGFAAETQNLQENARRKLAEKNLDAIAANDVSQTDAGFDSESNRVTWITRGAVREWPLEAKSEVARRLWDEVLVLRAAKTAAA